MMFSAHFLGCMFIVLRDSVLEGDPENLDNWMDAYDSDLRFAGNAERCVSLSLSLSLSLLISFSLSLSLSLCRTRG
jgi:hypothetical protein